MVTWTAKPGQIITITGGGGIRSVVMPFGGSGGAGAYSYSGYDPIRILGAPFSAEWRKLYRRERMRAMVMRGIDVL